jgi:hypothetical protein
MRFMYFSIFHWHRLVNGASGFFPRDYQEVRQVMYDFPSDDSMRLLRRYGVEFLVIHAKFYAASDHARLIDRVDRRKELSLVAREVWDGSELSLYRVGSTPAIGRSCPHPSADALC